MTQALPLDLIRSTTRVAAAVGLVASERGVSVDDALTVLDTEATLRHVTLAALADDVLHCGRLVASDA